MPIPIHPDVRARLAGLKVGLNSPKIEQVHYALTHYPTLEHVSANIDAWSQHLFPSQKNPDRDYREDDEDIAIGRYANALLESMMRINAYPHLPPTVKLLHRAVVEGNAGQVRMLAPRLKPALKRFKKQYPLGEPFAQIARAVLEKRPPTVKGFIYTAYTLSELSQRYRLGTQEERQQRALVFTTLRELDRRYNPENIEG